MNTATKLLKDHSSLAFSTIDDYSHVFYYFVKKAMTFGVPLNETTVPIHEFYNTFIRNDKISINSIDSLTKNLHGYLDLELRKSNAHKRLPVLTSDDEVLYITGGIYITPYAKSLFKDNVDIVNGILLDTTWKVIPYFVTSILMIEYMNVGIPVSFAFGSSENKELYNRHQDALKKHLGIDLNGFTIESDQGSALQAFTVEHAMTHLACLRHLLVSLRFSQYSYFAGILLKAVSHFDYANAVEKCGDFFKNSTKEDIEKLNQVFAKIGLNFNNGAVVIADPKRWDQVSMVERVKYRMPSTTNSLEATHGQLNKKTPRNNNFWHAIFRVASNLIQKTKTVDQHAHHNLQYTQRKINVKASNMPKDDMKKEIEHYHTNADSCLCGETLLQSALYNIDIPCSHRLALGQKNPKLEEIKLKLIESTDSLIITKKRLDDEVLTQELFIRKELC
jgi:hypothetical protein